MKPVFKNRVYTESTSSEEEESRAPDTGQDVGFDRSLMRFPSAEVPRRSRVAVSADREGINAMDTVLPDSHS